MPERVQRDAATHLALQASPTVIFATNRELDVTVAAGGLFGMLGVEPSEVIGRRVHEILGFGDERLTAFDRALAGHPADFDIAFAGHALHVDIGPMSVEGEILGVAGVATKAAGGGLLEAALERRIAHQEAVADLSLLALGGAPDEDLFARASAVVAQGLGAELASVVEVVGDEVQVRAFSGDAAGIPLRGTLKGTATEIAVTSGTPFVTGDASNDERIPQGLIVADWASVVAVPIPLRERTFGVLAAASPRLFAFSDDDTFFLESLAGVIGSALDRRQLERTFRAVFENAPDAIAILAQGRFARLNPAAAELFGRPVDEIVGLTVEELGALAGDSPRQTQENFARFLSGEAVDATVRRPDGEIRQVEVVGAVDFLPGHHLGVFRDVTERRALEGRLIQSQKMEVVGQLAAGIAHDFNNLLVAVRGLSGLVADELPPGSALRADVETIRQAGDRGVAIVNRLLLATRGRVRPPGLVALARVLSESRSLLRQSLPEDVELILSVDEDAGCVVADAGEVEQVLLNLLLNARDAMPHGGTISISVAATDLDEESAERLGIAADTYAVLTVRDNGIGMDPETQKRAFEPFFTTKEPGSGTGLGLPMVQNFARSTAGAVSVESEVGRGTAFSVFLPRVALSEARDEGALAKTPHGHGRILVVDDDPLSLRATQRILGSFGYEVVVAASAAEAEALAARLELDVIVSDVVMPDVRGVDLLDRLRALQPAVPVVLITGYAGDELVRRGIRTGQWRVVPKPFTAAELGRAIGHALAEESQT